MSRVTVASTRILASGRLEFSSDHRLRVALKVAALVALIAVALAALAQLRATGRAVPATHLEQQNAALLAEIASVRAELEIERSTRVALDGQVRELSAQAGELRRQLGFVTSQSRRPSDGRR